MRMRTPLARVLSIQSHVVHGYVGNKSAVFSLQLLGLDVDPINSVQFSNHTGYDVCKGEVLQGEQLLTLVSGLEANGLLKGYTHLLTGYIGSPSFLRAVVEVAQKLKAVNPGLQYVCDPVLGDDGRCYVPEELVEMYKSEVLPLADVLTPNQFEAEVLTGIKIETESDAQRACLYLHAHGPGTVVVTSAALATEDGEGTKGDCLHVLGSTRRSPKSWRALDMCRIIVPRLPGSYTGTGDLCAALLLAWLHKMPTNLPGVLERVIATVQATLWRTHDEAGPSAELRLVQSKEDIERPTVVHRATRLHRPRDIQGIVFDMDGTLTEPGQIDFKRIRQRLAIPPGDDILTHIDALPCPDARARALVVVEEEEVAGFHDVKLQEGAQRVVGWLRRTRRLRVALATRNNDQCVRMLVAQCFDGDEGTFRPVLTRVFKSEVDVHKIRGVCDEWGLPPSSVLIVGDSLEDCYWGHLAGCRTCLVHIGTAHTLEAMRSGYVHNVIESLEELMTIVGHEADEGEEGGDQDGPGAAGAGPS